MEKLLGIDWYIFVEDEKFMQVKQFQFRKVSLCATNIMIYISEWFVIQEREGWVNCIYMEVRSSRREMNLEEKEWSWKFLKNFPVLSA